jgi:site-specific recombinase XerD
MKDTLAFEKFLKKKGKKPHTIEKMIREVTAFSLFLQKTRKKDISDANSKDLDSYALDIKNIRQSMYCLMNFFQFSGNERLRKRVSNIREQQTNKTRKVFPLKDFMGINPEHIKILTQLGIKNVNEMLEEKISLKKLKFL